MNLLYTKNTFSENRTRYGYRVIQGIEDEYRNCFVRNNVVIRVDVLSGMNRLLTQETIEKNRDCIFSIFAGEETNAEKVSRLLKWMYSTDLQMQKYLTTLAYSNEKVLEERSLYTILIIEFSKGYKDSVDRIEKQFVNQGCSYICESRGYIYFGVRDKNVEVYDRLNVRKEVLSYAKIWNGKFL